MEDKKVHPLVEFMLARMESHPDEFKLHSDPRWAMPLQTIDEYGSEEDREAMITALGALRMNEAHEWALDELLNGEERRKQEEAERTKKLVAMQQAKMASQSGVLGQVYPPAVGAAPNNYLNVANLPLTSAASPSLQLGNTTLTESLLQQIKGKLGL